MVSVGIVWDNVIFNPTPTQEPQILCTSEHTVTKFWRKIRWVPKK